MGGSIGDIIKNVVTLGGYGQSKAQKEASSAQQRAEMEARRIAAEKKPIEESATLGLQEQNKSGGGILDLMINPDTTKKKNTMIGSGGTTPTIGLGTGA